ELHGGQVQVNLPPAARVWLLANEGERVLYRVVDLRDGRLVEGNADLGPWSADRLPQGTPQFRDAVVDGTRFRIGSVVRVFDPEDVSVLAEVGETLGRRQRVAQQTLAGSLLLFGLMIAVAVALVRTSIDSTLKPLGQLEAEAARRSGSNLKPLDPEIAPREVRGLILAINRMMKRVSDSFESQSRFIANAAHQLRTPIAGLRLQAQLAHDDVDPAATRRRLDEIDRSATRAAHVIDQLLTLSRSEAGAIPPNFDAVDLAEVAAQVIQRYLPAAEHRDVDLGYSGPPGPLLVAGNETLLSELLGNLVDNALRYGRRGGVVTVRTARVGSTLLLEVVDDGPGLGTLTPDNAFNRFQRGDAASDAGAGLGLAIVKEIAERHGATVSCESPTGGGFRVTVEFPEFAPRAAAAAAAAAPVGGE
ncbi:MAG TPA: sensor histidine kinase, partial [Burkholderiaceae bacterium]|nr:sensor histidine kinase [Burkholderiaceae bacterium]